MREIGVMLYNHDMNYGARSAHLVVPQEKKIRR